MSICKVFADETSLLSEVIDKINSHIINSDWKFLSAIGHINGNTI